MSYLTDYSYHYSACIRIIPEHGAPTRSADAPAGLGAIDDKSAAAHPDVRTCATMRRPFQLKRLPLITVPLSYLTDYTSYRMHARYSRTWYMYIYQRVRGGNLRSKPNSPRASDRVMPFDSRSTACLGSKPPTAPGVWTC